MQGQDEQQQGRSYRLRYAKSLLSTGTAVDLAAYRYSTRHYYSFSDFNNLGYELNDSQVPWALERQRSNFQMRVSQQLGDWGALYLSASLRFLVLLPVRCQILHFWQRSKQIHGEYFCANTLHQTKVFHRIFMAQPR
ncbi:fimbria/pilus outer membrane usher protein [Yersinia intermedia]|uniref:fimbria/pilus outer membrane usher protein n=1 Tax=Yersinia intermedia TaxID=631 RepID=UPI00067B8989|nr:fimbria/pilus outer membrane usher protein [Yersinia intermedia]